MASTQRKNRSKSSAKINWTCLEKVQKVEQRSRVNSMLFDNGQGSSPGSSTIMERIKSNPRLTFIAGDISYQSVRRRNSVASERGRSPLAVKVNSMAVEKYERQRYFSKVGMIDNAILVIIQPISFMCWQ